MKEIEIDRNSRLYRWVRKMNCIRDWEIEDGYVDSCEFNKAVIAAFGMSMLLAVPSGILAYITYITLRSIAEVCTWLFASYMFGFWIQISDAGHASLFYFSMVAFIAAVCGLFWAIEISKLNRIFNSPITIKMPSVVDELYDSFKEKYCKPIKFADSKD